MTETPLTVEQMHAKARAEMEQLVPGVSNLAGTPVASPGHPLGTPGRHSQVQPPASAPPAEPAVPNPFADAPLESLAPPPADVNPTPSAALDPAEVERLVRQQVANQFAITEAWQPKGQVKFIVYCPSGQQILVRHLSPLDMIEADIAEEIDFFQRRLFPADLDASGTPIEHEESATSTIWQTLKDIKKRQRFISLLSKIAATAVERPKVINDGCEIGRVDVTAENPQGRKIIVYGATAVEQVGIGQATQLFPNGAPGLPPGAVYASSVDFQDKMAIFDALNQPLSVITPFREPAVGLPVVEPGQGDGSPAE